MIREVLKYGDSRLIEPSLPVVAFGTPEFKALVSDLWETMEHERGVGIAAPQIGVKLRVVVFGFDANERYPDAESVPKTVLVNPIIRPLGLLQEEGAEGCLSVPEWRGPVERWSRIRYLGRDEHGQAVSGVAQGFHARVIQHECDHLDGILYPMRMSATSRLGGLANAAPTTCPNQLEGN